MAAAWQEVMAKTQRKPTRSLLPLVVVPLRMGWLGSHGSPGHRTRGREAGRQGRWWLLSSPRLAGPITDWFNMTGRTLLS